MIPPARSGVALVVCAPSGAGKTTLIKRLKDLCPDFAFSISCTTRQPRPGESDGVDYHFISKEEFLARLDQGFFAEWAEVHGNFYGTPLQATMQLLEKGKDVIFDIDVQGARQLRASMPEACLVFIFPPSRAELERRLMTRGTESEESLARRLAVSRKELQDAGRFDSWIVNDDLDRALADLLAVYKAATLSPARNRAFYSALMQEWEDG